MEIKEHINENMIYFYMMLKVTVTYTPSIDLILNGPDSLKNQGLNKIWFSFVVRSAGTYTVQGGVTA